MKRFLINNAIFFMMTAAVYLAGMVVLTKINYKGFHLTFFTADYYSAKGSHEYKRYREFNPEKAYDVLILGSSHAYRGYDTELLAQAGISSFNLGSSGQRMTETAVLTREFINLEKVDLLLIDIYPGNFEPGGIESASRLIANLPDADVARSIALNMRDWRGVNMYVYRELTPDLAIARMHPGDRYVSGGYVDRPDSINYEVEWSKIGKKLEIDSRQWESFERLVDFLSNANIPVMLVTHPAPKQIDRTAMDAFEKKVNALIDSYENIFYYNYAFRHGLDSRDHFYDPSHMNSTGVEIFNSGILLPDLQQLVEK